MQQAVVTKYLGPTNNRGPRVKARCWAGSKTLTWDHSMSTIANHRAAAQELVDDFEWGENYKLKGGSLFDSYVFVLVKRKGA